MNQTSQHSSLVKKQKTKYLPPHNKNKSSLKFDPTIIQFYYKTSPNFSSFPLLSSNNNNDDSSSFPTFLISKLVSLIAFNASPSQSVLAKTAYSIETAQAAWAESNPNHNPLNPIFNQNASPTATGVPTK